MGWYEKAIPKNGASNDEVNDAWREHVSPMIKWGSITFIVTTIASTVAQYFLLDLLLDPKKKERKLTFKEKAMKFAKENKKKIAIGSAAGFFGLYWLWGYFFPSDTEMIEEK